MVRLLLFCLAAILLACLVLGACARGDVTERVLQLPQDQNKWHLSVVGDPQDARYREVLGWFDSNKSLSEVKGQVHFHAVLTSDPIYQERYAPNTKVLPMVRMQNAQGVVLYEACGKDLPATGYGLYTAIVWKSDLTQGILRHRQERRQQAEPEPQPQSEPQPQVQPEPQPQPEPEVPFDPTWPLVALCLVVLGYSGFRAYQGRF